MDRNEAIVRLVEYAVSKGLIEECDRVWAVNSILETLKLDSFEAPAWFEWEEAPGEMELAPILEVLLDDAYQRGVLEENSVVYRDLLDTA
ncbi:MAG: galactose-1-phosphate uridylyltransferase, partial [Oscillospiraceae bacterium]|nr:galactose-1-phosphate uridylyltransferase [Oscillospiraceae bacterium]